MFLAYVASIDECDFLQIMMLIYLHWKIDETWIATNSLMFPKLFLVSTLPTHHYRVGKGEGNLFPSPFIADVSVVPVFMQATVDIWSADRHLLIAKCYLCISGNRTLTKTFVYSSQMSDLSQRFCHPAKLANLPTRVCLSIYLPSLAVCPNWCLLKPFVDQVTNSVTWVVKPLCYAQVHA